jgi:hypothetical protein
MSHRIKLISAVLVLAMISMSGSIMLGHASAALPNGWSGGVIVNNQQNKTATVSDCVIDSANKLHVVYTWMDNSSGQNQYSLMYSDNSGGTWSTPVKVDNASFNFFGSGHSIAVDSQGKTYITYTNSGGLKVATNAGGSWVNTTIDSSNVYSNPSIAIDHSDKVHISYFRYLIGLGTFEIGIVHATNSGGTWTNETVVNLPLGNVALGTAIAVDSSNHVTIAFVNYSALSGTLAGNVTLVSNAAGSWQSTQLDTSGAALGAMAITIDHNNYDDVLYMTSTNLTNELNGTLKYATNSGGTWTSQTVTNLIGYAYLYGAHIVVDTANKPTICYVNVTLSNEANSTNVTYTQINIWTLNNGLWSVAAIPYSFFPSMAIDSNNNLYVVYLGYSSLNNINNSALYYATSAVSTVNTAPSVPNGFGVSAGNAQVAISWTAPSSNGGQTISGYNIYRGPSASSTTLLTTVGASTFTYLDTTVTNGVDYYYNVAAVNSVGVGTATSSMLAQPSTTVNNNVPPGPVTNINVKTDDGKVTLNWNAPTTGGLSSYILIYRSTSNVQPSTPIGNVSGTTTQYVDTNVSNGVNYYYWIVPANSIGSGTPASSGIVTPNASSSDNSLMIAIVAVIVIIIIVALVFILLRRRKK